MDSKCRGLADTWDPLPAKWHRCLPTLSLFSPSHPSVPRPRSTHVHLRTRAHTRTRFCNTAPKLEKPGGGPALCPWHPSDLGVSSLGTKPPGFSAHVPSSPQDGTPRLPHRRPPCRSPGRVRSLGLPAVPAGPGPQRRWLLSLPHLLGHPLLGHAASICAHHRVSDPTNSPLPYGPVSLPSVHALRCQPPKS